VLDCGNAAIIAEGVETREQLQRLLQCQCDYIQGYLVGRPADEVATVAILLSDC